MSKCQQCLYYPHCDEYPFDESGCDDFKDNSQFVEVVHGRWIHDINNLYGCSECGQRDVLRVRTKRKFCSYCGARMDEVVY